MRGTRNSIVWGLYLFSFGEGAYGARDGRGFLSCCERALNVQEMAGLVFFFRNIFLQERGGT